MTPPPVTSSDLAQLQGPVLVTAAYFGLWYTLLLGLQRGTKYKLQAEYAERGETFDRYFGQDRRMLAVDRVVTNTLEQMGPFLASLWLHAVFVSPTTATWLGAAYVLLRAAYPKVLGSSLGAMQSKRIFVVTGPAYLIIAYLLGSSVAAVL